MTETITPTMKLPSVLQSVAAHQRHINKLWSEIAIEASVIRNMLINRQIEKDGRFYKVTDVNLVGRMVAIKGIEIGKKRKVQLGIATSITEVLK